jgi:MarR family transcriptional regulator, organic hydroperoxide resistance regulator
MSNSAAVAGTLDYAIRQDEALEFMGLLWAIDECLERMSRKMLRDIGVTGPQRMVLRLIGHLSEPTARDLAHILHLHPSTISGIVRRLEAEGHIVRIPNPGDGRSWHLRLTRTGQKIVASNHGTIEGGIREALGQISPEDRMAATFALRRLRASLSLELSATG